MFTVRNLCLGAVDGGIVIEMCMKIMPSVRFQVITEVDMKSSTFWDITTCSYLKVCRCFGGTLRLFLLYLLHSGFLFG
jgi:hypothetical protein